MPALDGYAMPPEWSAHARTWMAWPRRAELWGEKLDEACDAYAEVARAIVAFEPVTMVTTPDQVAEVSVRCGQGVATLALAHDDSWMRDTGPTFIVNPEGEVAGIHWRFNAWGGKHADYADDARMAAGVLANLGMARYEAPLVMEGGAFHVDGEGTLIATEQCLLHPNRNRGISKSKIEQHLKEFLGVQAIVWLGEGLEGDETDGHVDNVACFARPGVVLLQGCQDSADANARIQADNAARLKAAKDAKGRAIEVIELPAPKRRDRPQAEKPGNGNPPGRLTLSYANLYICNGAVILPAFDDPADGRAFDIAAKAFPERKVVQIQALDIVQGGGGIHCITQQQPAGKPAP